MLKDIQITEQPVCACVPLDFPLTLHCKAQGPTKLCYQWFMQRESTCREIPGATLPDLHIHARQTNLYICRVNDKNRRILFSNWVKVKVLKDIPFGAIPPDWNGKPIIVTEPVSAHLTSRDAARLCCYAMGLPAPEYQWYHNGLCLPHRREKEIKIKSVRQKDSGSYLCHVSNVHGEMWSEPAELTIEDDIILQASPQPSVCPGLTPRHRYFATGKVALLIGNNGYLNHANLLAPMVDVFELSVLLRRLGFCVISLIDLTQEEMVLSIRQFLQLLEKGVYGLFYYAGHGYECSGRNYMVPIDAPQPYRPENCISVQRILQQMQDRKTALNVVLLDTCRKWYNSDCALSKVIPLKPWGNTVYGYATSENAEAYEVQDEAFSSGIFMTYLKKHILKEQKVTQMLDEVLEDIGRDPLVTGKQVMEIRHSLKESRALTDKICFSGSVQLNRTVWDQRTKIPKQVVKFSCGVEVELRFKVVFSNLIHAFAKRTRIPPHLSDVRIILYNPTDSAEFSNNRLDPADSLLTMEDDGEEVDYMLRLCSLQKYKNNIIINIDLHCTILDTGERVQETLEEIIPIPWIARLLNNRNTYVERNQTNRAAVKASIPSLQSQLDSMSIDKEPPPAHHLPNAVETPCSSQSKSSSEPEENDEGDILPVL
ncbi:mucosa-associated lymphoid tissue lymphoma translocation protein 1-like [Bufo gargarizans]|uniref:mucosa-associated lymphoid tissue lymphoma translocation protein 1-like n=1 Tax=Bufo gargarizans TaxID=30331 RepID=UPI001CF238B1|nr:mucosa-associated lymphoid tissue lymphoma translocation protein 1-like [Bufo gargarizans]XP_044139320.1 mucosa-associated lymphoid tissue lymphoma translocation protein 1-like [Bufo gargarizans]XP_044139321.1 mucosa-associated lymphoid tissue lymphoma translocation protein 1-like [Bufo gargarizans]